MKSRSRNASWLFISKAEVVAANLDGNVLTAKNFALEEIIDYGQIEPAAGAVNTVDSFDGAEDPFPTLEVIDDRSTQSSLD